MLNDPGIGLYWDREEAGRMLTVDDYYRIRYLHHQKGMSQREIAAQLGHTWRSVKKALKRSAPPGYQRKKPVPHPVLQVYMTLIDAWLKDDQSRPKKQRHTAKRIYDRLVEEHNFTGSLSAVQRYVAHKKSTSGEVFYPLEFEPGEEAQVDWGEGWIEKNGLPQKAMIFCMRLCYSTASFVYAYPFQKLDGNQRGHVRAFEFFGGVARRQAYDNLKTAVKKIEKGHDRELQERFKEMRSHYVFESRFCNPAHGNEKGHVENLVKYAQRTFMTPIPSCSSFEELNAYLLERCLRDLDQKVPARGNKTRRELLEEERPFFLPLPSERFDPCINLKRTVSKQSLICFEKNDYSVPVRYAYHSADVKGYVDHVDIYVHGERVASHQRSLESGQFILDYEHYIPLLERKPGGIHNGRPFKGEPWGEAFQRMRKELEERYEGGGTRQFIEILLLFSERGVSAVKSAVSECVRLRTFSADAVISILDYVPPKKVGQLELSKRPELILSCDGIRSATEYEQLCVGKEALA